MNIFVLGLTGLVLLVNTLVTPAATLLVLADKSLDLTTRERSPYVNQVFADNITLSLHYLKGDVGSLPINWDEVRQPFEVDFTLDPNETFAFHANLEKEAKKPKATMNSRFFVDEGYLTVGGLGGNGVCHLASLIAWAASEADLDVIAEVKHDFAPVPGVPSQFGASIYSQDPRQNLVIRNDKDYPVTFHFQVDSESVNLKIVKEAIGA